ncbi:MAG: polysaccharide biosynthesis/export family protein, partial [Bryobacteraceae bacterium]
LRRSRRGGLKNKMKFAAPGILFAVMLAAQSPTLIPAATTPAATATTAAPTHDYLLGPDDQIKIWALGFEEFSDKPVRIDPSGYVDLPILGRIKAAGLSTEQLRADLLQRMTKLVKRPEASVEIVDYGSQPVSVIGAVNQPGVKQLQGRKTLAEVLSMAGGLRPDSGAVIKITRETGEGAIPLPTAEPDSTGRYSTAELRVTDFLGAKNPASNIVIRPHDVITVPAGETISVIGAVQKPGEFPLNTRTNVSVLQGLAMAGGLGSTPKDQDARILRLVPGSPDRKEIPVNLRKILAGKEEDVALRPNDILLVPASLPKRAAAKIGEAALQAAVGVAIWRGF